MLKRDPESGVVAYTKGSRFTDEEVRAVVRKVLNDAPEKLASFQRKNMSFYGYKKDYEWEMTSRGRFHVTVGDFTLHVFTNFPESVEDRWIARCDGFFDNTVLEATTEKEAKEEAQLMLLRKSLSIAFDLGCSVSYPQDPDKFLNYDKEKEDERSIPHEEATYILLNTFLIPLFTVEGEEKTNRAILDEVAKIALPNSPRNDPNFLLNRALNLDEHTARVELYSKL